MKEIVYNNNDYDVYVMGDSTIITPKGHGGQLMSAEALLLALKNNRVVNSGAILIDEERVIMAQEDRDNDKPKIQRKHGCKKSWSRDNRKKR